MAPAGGLSRIHQISMRAHDIERATKFYRDALGLAFLFAAPPQLAFFDCAGVRLLLDRIQGLVRSGDAEEYVALASDGADLGRAHNEELVSSALDL